jgi:hypothetical protein
MVNNANLQAIVIVIELNYRTLVSPGRHQKISLWTLFARSASTLKKSAADN